MTMVPVSPTASRSAAMSPSGPPSTGPIARNDECTTTTAPAPTPRLRSSPAIRAGAIGSPLPASRVPASRVPASRVPAARVPPARVTTRSDAPALGQLERALVIRDRLALPLGAADDRLATLGALPERD